MIILCEYIRNSFPYQKRQQIEKKKRDVAAHHRTSIWAELQHNNIHNKIARGMFYSNIYDKKCISLASSSSSPRSAVETLSNTFERYHFFVFDILRHSLLREKKNRHHILYIREKRGNGISTSSDSIWLSSVEYLAFKGNGKNANFRLFRCFWPDIIHKYI